MNGRVRFATYILIAAAISLIFTVGMMIYMAVGPASQREISEQSQLELFAICETHPHLRAAYHRANTDGMITNGERDEILDQLRTAMRRGIPSGE